MPIITKDCRTLEKFSLWGCIKATVAWYYYSYLMRPLKEFGFLTTEEGCYMSWKDFTFHPWKELHKRQEVAYERGLKDGNAIAIEEIADKFSLFETHD